MEQVSLDDVGSAEQVLNRYIQERRSLDAAVRVLETYRMTVSALQPAIEELAAVELAVQKARQELSGVEAAKQKAMQEAAKSVEEYRVSKVEEVQSHIDRLLEERTALVSEVSGLERRIKELDESYAARMEANQRDYDRISVGLEAMKAEHRALSEAIGKAAQMFGR